MDQHRLNLLFEKYQQGTLSPLEEDELNDWFHSLNLGGTEFETWVAQAGGSESYTEKRLESFKTHINTLQKPIKTISLWPRVAAAASIVIALSIGGYFILHKQQPQQIAKLKPGTFKNDVLPGDKAVLTLSNGKKISVSGAKSGSLAQQGLINIQKSTNGNLVYKSTQGVAESTEIAYNTLTTLRGGGKHSLQLADGTFAVLDAGSSITYPVAFTGKERQVKIIGQVYFEVAHNAKMPFSVVAKNQVIRDLGTHFNVNAYDDEDNVKTTLLEGSLSVNSDKNKGFTLKPGQQAIATSDGNIMIKSDVALDVVMAWKNDLFKFDNNTSLPAVMRQLSRWYDLDVIFEGSKKHYNFGGDIPRNSKLSEVLKILEYSGVQFTIDGNKLIVYQ